MEGGLLRQSFHVAVTVKPLFRDKHAVDELTAYLGRPVEVFCGFLLSINATIGQRRDSHEHVVQPDGVVLRAVACECAVGQAVLSVFDESEIIFYQVGQRQDGSAIRAFIMAQHMAPASSNAFGCRICSI